MKNIDEITEQLEAGVKGVFSCEQYRAYLDFASKFYDYSVNNTILIFMQMPSASYVAGYQAWQKKFKRQVRKGEKGIRIMAPCPHKHIEKIVDAEGNEREREIRYNTYRAVSVFDISQTDGEPIPETVKELTGTVENYAELFEKLKAVSPVPVELEEIDTGAHGYFSRVENRIAIKAGMPEQQTVKTLIHEISHSLLHGEDGEEKEAHRGAKEVQAESVAYIVCNTLGLDTSDYSFGYIAGWSSDKEVKELVESMEVIKKTAAAIIAAVKEA